MNVALLVKDTTPGSQGPLKHRKLGVTIVPVTTTQHLWAVTTLRRSLPGTTLQVQQPLENTARCGMNSTCTGIHSTPEYWNEFHLYCILCFYKFYCHLTVSKE